MGYRNVKVVQHVAAAFRLWFVGVFGIAAVEFSYSCMSNGREFRLFGIERDGRRIPLSPAERTFFSGFLLDHVNKSIEDRPGFRALSCVHSIELTPEVEAILSRPKFGIDVDKLHAIENIE